MTYESLHYIYLENGFIILKNIHPYISVIFFGLTEPWLMYEWDVSSTNSDSVMLLNLLSSQKSAESSKALWDDSYRAKAISRSTVSYNNKGHSV